MFSVSMSSYIKRPPRPRSPLSVVPPPSLEADEMQFDWRQGFDVIFQSTFSFFFLLLSFIFLKFKNRTVRNETTN